MQTATKIETPLDDDLLSAATLAQRERDRRAHTAAERAKKRAALVTALGSEEAADAALREIDEREAEERRRVADEIKAARAKEADAARALRAADAKARFDSECEMHVAQMFEAMCTLLESDRALVNLHVREHESAPHIYHAREAFAARVRQFFLERQIAPDAFQQIFLFLSR